MNTSINNLAIPSLWKYEVNRLNYKFNNIEDRDKYLNIRGYKKILGKWKGFRQR